MNGEWWQILLSGLIGSVLGGLATLAGVVLVVRHERQQRSRDVIDESVATLLHASRRLGLAPRKDQASNDLHYALIDAINLSSLRSSRAEPRLHAATQRLLDATIDSRPGSQRHEDLAVAAIILASTWLATPDVIRNGTVTFDTALRSATDRTSAWR
jgi:hypothetical protein